MEKTHWSQAPDQIRQMGGRAFSYIVDHSDEDAVLQFTDHVLEEHGKVDVLCCNAGVFHQGTMIQIYDRLGTHPRTVAKAGVRGVIKNTPIIRTPLWHLQGMHVLYKWFPGLASRLGTFLFKRGWSAIGPILK